MDERIDYLGNVLILSMLDENWCYEQVETDKADRDRTRFPIHHGLL